MAVPFGNTQARVWFPARPTRQRKNVSEAADRSHPDKAVSHEGQSSTPPKEAHVCLFLVAVNHVVTAYLQTIGPSGANEDGVHGGQGSANIMGAGPVCLLLMMVDYLVTILLL